MTVHLAHPTLKACHGGFSAIVHGTVNLCWGLFKWGLLVALIAAIAAVPFFYDRLDSEIRQRLLTMLSEQYQDLGISIRSAQFVEGEGIEVRDLVIVETGAAGPQAELLCLPEVFLHSRGTLQELLSGSLQVRRGRGATARAADDPAARRGPGVAPACCPCRNWATGNSRFRQFASRTRPSRSSIRPRTRRRCWLCAT